MCYHMTDLAAASRLLNPNIASLGTLGSPELSFIHSLLPNITKLDIILSLPLAFFQHFQPHPSTQDEDGEEVQHLKVLAETWLALPQSLANRLPSLRRLRIWLDHTDRSYWSVVDERAVLRHFEQLARSPHLDLSCDLPKLHPLQEDPARHFVNNDVVGESGSSSSLPPIQVRRRLRQRWRAKRTDVGYGWPYWVRDFPLAFGTAWFIDVSLEELEQLEKTMELDGIRMEELLSNAQHLSGPTLADIHP